MSGYNLNYDLFYSSQFEDGVEVKAIAVIEYPIIHLIANTIETAEETFDQLDRFLLSEVFQNGILDIQKLCAITGINGAVFQFRARALQEQGYLEMDGVGNLIGNEKAGKWIESPLIERLNTKTRSFLVDGIDHQPLLAYFYKEGSEFLVPDTKKDLRGRKVFNPSFIHNPPAAGLKDKILGIDLSNRALFNIPQGLREIKDYDFGLMTFPIAIVLGTDKGGRVVKSINNCNGFHAHPESVYPWADKLKPYIAGLNLSIFENSRDLMEQKVLTFRNNWASVGDGDDVIFNINDNAFMVMLLMRHYNTDAFPEDAVSITKNKITLKVSSELLRSDTIKKRSLFEALLRQRDYLTQGPWTGVWMVFIDVEPADELIKELILLYSSIRKGDTMLDILSRHNHDYMRLRIHLIMIGAFDYLEELDIYLFMYARESGGELKYKEI